MPFGTGSRGESFTTLLLPLLLQFTPLSRGLAQVQRPQLLPTLFFRCFSWPYLPTSHTVPLTSLIFPLKCLVSDRNGCDCDSRSTLSVLRLPQSWRTSTLDLSSGLTSNYALERLVNGFSERAAGAQTIVAPAAQNCALLRPAQRGR